MTDYDLVRVRRLTIWVWYEGPFAKMCNYLWRIDVPRDEDGNAIDPADAVEDGSLRDRLACFFERFDTRWRNHYAKRDKNPPERWKRR